MRWSARWVPSALRFHAFAATIFFQRLASCGSGRYIEEVCSVYNEYRVICSYKDASENTSVQENRIKLWVSVC